GVPRGRGRVRPRLLGGLPRPAAGDLHRMRQVGSAARSWPVGPMSVRISGGRPSPERHAMQRIRFVMVGGFLGAGKTTTLARLARHYLSRGQRIGLVTNDQAQDLVDTNSLRGQGFPVEEVAGACFCCRFDDLM